jgi:hypothetical protein
MEGTGAVRDQNGVGGRRSDNDASRFDQPCHHRRDREIPSSTTITARMLMLLSRCRCLAAEQPGQQPDHPRPADYPHDDPPRAAPQLRAQGEALSQ